MIAGPIAVYLALGPGVDSKGGEPRPDERSAVLVRQPPAQQAQGPLVGPQRLHPSLQKIGEGDVSSSGRGAGGGRVSGDLLRGLRSAPGRSAHRREYNASLPRPLTGRDRNIPRSASFGLAYCAGPDYTRSVTWTARSETS